MATKQTTDREVKGKLTATVKGKKFELEKSALEDIEFLELSGEIEENPTKLPALLKLLFGDDGYKQLKDISKVDGRTKTETVMENYQAVMEAMDSKNS